MEIAYLEEFLVFAKTLNLTHASKELYISPTTLSNHIRDLEKRIGCPLVQKTAKGQLSFTSAGAQFVQSAPQITRLWHQLLEDCAKKGNDLVVRVASNCSYSYLEEGLQNARASFQAKFGRRVVIETDSTFINLREAIREGGAVLSWTWGMPRTSKLPTALFEDAFEEGLQGTYLATDEYWICMQKDNPLFDKPVITTADLQDSFAVTPFDGTAAAWAQAIEACFAQRGIRFRVVLQPSSNFSDYAVYGLENGSLRFVAEKVAANLGLFSNASIRLFKLEDMRFYTDIFAIRAKNGLEDGVLRFIEEFESLIHAQTGEEAGGDAQPSLAE